MRSSFFEYHVAISGTFTARSNLEIISHNTANAAIKGYSRQVPMQKASEPLALNNGKGMVGTGSEVYAVTRERDIFLDTKYWAQSGVMGEYSGKKSQLAMIEGIFNEMGSNAGLSAAVNDFFAKASDLSTTANDSTYRTNLIQSANSLAGLINANANALRKQQTDANSEVSIVVEQINSLGEQIVGLNKRIIAQEMDGSQANDMRDERVRLVDELSRLVNIEVNEIDRGTALNPSNKHYTVTLNGFDFINHYNINPLMVTERDIKRNPMDIKGLYDITFMNNNVVFDIYHPKLKGQLKGLIDIRDGNGASAASLPVTDYKGIPYYLEKLNTFVRNLSLAIDLGMYADRTKIQGAVGHAYGYNLYSNSGTLMFTFGDEPEYGVLPSILSPAELAAFIDDFYYTKMDCFNFRVNKALIKDPKLVNCAPDWLQGESAYAVTKGFEMINSDPSLFKEGKLNDFITAIQSELGIDTKQAGNFEASYGDMMTVIDNQRIDVSGVDLNEEMINMVKNQQLYQASAKLVSTINSIYDTLINRLGA